MAKVGKEKGYCCVDVGISGGMYCSEVLVGIDEWEWADGG